MKKENDELLVLSQELEVIIEPSDVITQDMIYLVGGGPGGLPGGGPIGPTGDCPKLTSCECYQTTKCTIKI